MSKQVCWADVRVPDPPRVRFVAIDASAQSKLRDVTDRVSKLVIEDLQDDSGQCDLLRLDRDGKLVWKTRHPSLQETKWHVEFEYAFTEEQWKEFAP